MSSAMKLPFRLVTAARWTSMPQQQWLSFSQSLQLRDTAQRSFSASTRVFGAAPLPPRTPLPTKDYTISYLKGSGPGGQKINKTSSAVQIKHLPTGFVIKCQDTRSRDQNEKLAMRRLQDKLEMEEKKGTGELSRVERRWELLRKRKASKAKKAKRKYRALEDGEEDVDEEAEFEDDEVHHNPEARGEEQSANKVPEQSTKAKTQKAAKLALLLERQRTESPSSEHG